MRHSSSGTGLGVGRSVLDLDRSLDILSRVETPLDVGRSASEIYAYLLDFSRLVDWSHTCLTVEDLTPGPPQPGSRLRLREKQDLRADKLPFTTIADRLGADYVSEVEITALEPNRCIEWTSGVSDRPFASHWRVVLEPVTDSITTVRMTVRLMSPREALEAWMRELQTIGHPLDIVARQVDRALHNLRAILEGRARPAQ